MVFKARLHLVVSDLDLIQVRQHTTSTLICARVGFPIQYFSTHIMAFQLLIIITMLLIPILIFIA